MVRRTPRLLRFITWHDCAYVPCRVVLNGHVRYFIVERATGKVVGGGGNDKNRVIHQAANASGFSVAGRVYTYNVANEATWRAALRKNSSHETA